MEQALFEFLLHHDEVITVGTARRLISEFGATFDLRDVE